MNTHIIQLFVALFAIGNPFGNLPIFINLTKRYSYRDSNKTALQTAIAYFIIMTVTIWIGMQVLNFFGISMQAFQIAGGIIIAGIGLSMLNGNDDSDRQDATEQEHKSIAVVPLAMPMLSGPGAITTLVLHAHYFPSTEGRLIEMGVCGALAVLILVVFLAAPIITRLLKEKGIAIITKLMGLILTAIAIQMVVNGVLVLAPRLVN